MINIYFNMKSYKQFVILALLGNIKAVQLESGTSCSLSGVIGVRCTSSIGNEDLLMVNNNRWKYDVKIGTWGDFPDLPTPVKEQSEGYYSLKSNDAVHAQKFA